MSSRVTSIDTPAAGHAHGKMFWFVLLLGALAAIGPFSIDTYLPAFPAIAETFHTSVGAVEITLAVYFVGLSVGQLFYGPFADSFGRKPPLYFGLALYILSSLACAAAPSIGVLTAARFFQAVGGASCMLIPRTVVRDYFTPREGARVFSFLMLVIGVSPMVAPLVGGWLVVHMSWRATFVMVATFGVICFICVMIFLKESLPREKRGPLSLAGTLATYARLFKDRVFLVNSISGGLVATGMFAYLEGSPGVFMQLYKVPADHFGYYFGAIALMLVLASQLNGFLVRRIDPFKIMRGVLIAVTIASIVLFTVAKTGLFGIWGMFFSLVAFIWCNGMTFPNATALAMAPHGRIAGSASALLGFLQFMLGGIGGTIVSKMNDGSAMPMASVMAFCGCLAMLLHFAFGRKFTGSDH